MKFSETVPTDDTLGIGDQSKKSGSWGRGSMQSGKQKDDFEGRLVDAHGP